MKRCTKCGIEKELIFFCKDKGKKDGLSTWCKNCFSIKAKQYRLSHAEHLREYRKKYHEEHQSILAKNKRIYRSENREKMRLHDRMAYRERREKALEQSRKSHIKHKEQIIEQRKRYYYEHKEMMAERVKAWQKKNPEKLQLNNRKRKARMMQLQATLTEEQWVNIKDYFGNRCAYCGGKSALHQEHFIALSSLGEYTHNNILPSCPRCNFSKNAKSFFEWYPKQVFYSKTREKKILKFLNYKDGKQQLAFTL